ncbi:MAG TPA: hypothetical protein VE033_09310 [Acetobacteraceae bacterium]|jgi:hypothetical protein|nr:hypothetical protein [Acetobacteraceae bacterium]
MKTEETKRRGVLGLLGLAGTAAAATSAQAFNIDGGRDGQPSRPETEAEKRKPRYRETEHVQAFYRTNRG